MKSFTSRAMIYGLFTLFGLLCALPNVLPESVSNKLPAWYADNTLALGLDLRGGSHLLLEVDTTELLHNDTRQLASDLGEAFRRDRLAFSIQVLSPTSLQITAKGAAKNSQTIATLRRVAQSLNTLDDSSGPRFSIKQDQDLLTLSMTDVHREQLISDAVERSLEVVRRRLDETGLVEPSITRQGVDGILVQMPGVANPQEIRRLPGTTAKMTFHWVVDGQPRNIISVPAADQQTLYQLESRVAMPLPWASAPVCLARFWSSLSCAVFTGAGGVDRLCRSVHQRSLDLWCTQSARGNADATRHRRHHSQYRHGG